MLKSLPNGICDFSSLSMQCHSERSAQREAEEPPHFAFAPHEPHSERSGIEGLHFTRPSTEVSS